MSRVQGTLKLDDYAGAVTRVLFVQPNGDVVAVLDPFVDTTGDTMTGDLLFDGPSTDAIFQNGAGIVVLPGGAAEIPAGTEALPSLRVGDDNTGIFLPANNLLGITAGGSVSAEWGFTVNTLYKTMVLDAYPNTVDDGPTTNALYTDANGEIKHGPIDFPVYGQGWDRSSGGGVSNNTTTPQSVAPLAYTAPSTGLYEVVCTYRWGYNSGSTDFIGQLYQDGAPLGAGPHRQEPKDAAGTGFGGTDQRHPAILRTYVSLTAGDTPTFDLRYNSSSAGVLASVFDVELTVMRVQ